MKIAHRRGHNFKTVGAEGIIKEVEYCNQIHNCVDRQLTELNETHINVNPSDNYGLNDTNFSVKKANDLKADFYFSIHMNSYDSKANGTEVIVYNDKNLPQAKRVLKNLTELGFKSRGVKTMKEIGRSLNELKGTKMDAIIIEICFCDNKQDTDLVKRIGVERIAKAITEGVTNKSLIQESTDRYYQVVTGSYKDKNNALKEVDKLKKLGLNPFLDIEVK